MIWRGIFPLLLGLLLAACNGGGEEVEPTPLPSPAVAQPSPTTEIAITPETTTPDEPTPEVADEYEGWLTYTNDVYGYEFRYPPEATVGEAEEDEFHRVCAGVQYELGYVDITLPPNEDLPYVFCGRTSRAYEGPDREETLVIDGRTYTAQGFEEQGPGETLNYHNETLVVFLDDGTRIEYGARPSDMATFEDYLRIRDQLLKIVQSYRKLP